MALRLPKLLLYILSSISVLSFGSFALISLKEKELRSARISGALALLISTVFLAVTFASQILQWWLIGFCALILVLFIIAFLMPIGEFPKMLEIPKSRFDERRVIFARARLQPGSERYHTYYKNHPEDFDVDEKWRGNPGLLSPETLFVEPFAFASAEASFSIPETLRETVDGHISSTVQTVNPQAASKYIKALGKYYGALDVGICKLQAYHIYSHIGRGTGTYGEPIELSHQFGIAITVEMDYEMIGANPKAPGLMESAHQYAEAARVAVQLAAAIRALGYPARAHIDGNYRVIAPLLARDAGLGEMSRMGLLITPRKGPRVRISIVTTDLPLIADEPTIDNSVIDFCTICKKCAEACPSQAIAYDDRHKVDGALRWRINPNQCYRYWTIAGTDCGRCMTVCPYAHADNLIHNLIRWGVKHSGFFRRVALVMDNLFYGKTPAQRPEPAWTKLIQDSDKH